MSQHGQDDEFLETDGLTDLIEEIRLRTWARLNYHSPDERNQRWHPIILDEMQQRDLDATV